MTGQVFAGRFVAGDGEAARASFAIESDQVVIVGPNGRDHRWSVHEIAVTAVSSPLFQFDIAGEKAVFEADSPARFLFEFVPELRAARHAYPAPEPAPESLPPGGDRDPVPAAEIEAAAVAVETLVATAEEAADLVIDLRPPDRREADTEAPGGSLSEAVRNHNQGTERLPAAGDQASDQRPGAGHVRESPFAAVQEPASEPKPQPERMAGPGHAHGTVDGRGEAADAIKPTASFGTDPASVQLREPWDTITPKLVNRSARDVAAPPGLPSSPPGPPDASNPDREVVSGHPIEAPADGSAAAHATDPDAGPEPAGPVPVQPGAPAGQGQAAAPSEAVPRQGASATQSEIRGGRQRPAPIRTGPGITRTGLGDLVKAARGDRPDASPVTASDVSDLRHRARLEPEVEMSRRSLLEDFRRRWRSRRPTRTDDVAPTTTLPSTQAMPGPKATEAGASGIGPAAIPATDEASDVTRTGEQTLTPDAAHHSEPAVPQPPRANQPAANTRLDDIPAVDPSADACVHVWDESLPPGAVTRSCVRCQTVEAMPATDDRSQEAPPAGGAGPRSRARSELLRQAAARRRAYRSRWSG